MNEWISSFLFLRVPKFSTDWTWMKEWNDWILFNAIHVKRFQCFLVFVSTSVALRIFSFLFLRVPKFSPDWIWMKSWIYHPYWWWPTILIFRLVCGESVLAQGSRLPTRDRSPAAAQAGWEKSIEGDRHIAILGGKFCENTMTFWLQAVGSRPAISRPRRHTLRGRRA